MVKVSLKNGDKVKRGHRFESRELQFNIEILDNI